MTVVEDLAFVINVMQKQIKGGDSLGKPFFDVLPLRRGDQARQQIVGKDSLCSFAVPVDVEGDALSKERKVNRTLPARDLLRRKV